MRVTMTSTIHCQSFSDPETLGISIIHLIKMDYGITFTYVM